MAMSVAAEIFEDECCMDIESCRERDECARAIGPWRDILSISTTSLQTRIISAIPFFQNCEELSLLALEAAPCKCRPSCGAR
jgi:hypothetical protein